MRKIIIFGNVPLATWVVKEILRRREYDLVGVVCDQYDEDAFSHHGMKEKSLYSYCQKEKIRVLGFYEASEIARADEILGISIRYHKLFKRSYFSKFKPGIINLHGGELPRYRGANIANYAILEEASSAGGTLHFIDDDIDSGNIVERVILPIREKMTAFDYFTITLEALKLAFMRFIDRDDVRDFSRELISIPQSVYIGKGESSKLYYKKGIEDKRIQDFKDVQFCWGKLYKLARAYSFPGHPGLIIKNGNEFVEVIVKKND